MVAWLAHRHHRKAMDGNLGLDLTFVYRLPKRGTRAPGEYRSSTPDIDNLIKQVMDVLESVWWDKDENIVEVAARKVYGNKDATIIAAYMLGDTVKEGLWRKSER